MQAKSRVHKGKEHAGISAGTECAGLADPEKCNPGLCARCLVQYADHIVQSSLLEGAGMNHHDDGPQKRVE
eukprot:221966-Pelagomonas_calceolata.AAC.1